MRLPLLILALAAASQARKFSITDPLQNLFDGGSLPGTDWVMKGSSEPQDIHTVTFASRPKPHAAETCDSYLQLASHPDSPTFGMYHDLTKIHSTFSNPDATEHIQSYLKSRGLRGNNRGEFTSVTAQVWQLEELLDAKFLRFFSRTTHTLLHRTRSYQVPKALEPYVDFVANTVSFPLHKAHIVAHSRSESKQVTPGLIFNLYNVLSPIVNNAHATQSIFAALKQSYDPADLSAFQTKHNLFPTPVSNVIGQNNPKACTTNVDNCSEGALDIEYITAVAQNATTTYWSIPTDSQDPFLDWVIAVSTTQKPPLVHSISYGAIEGLVPQEHMTRFSLEACKLGLRGVTIVVSSGDDGVANYLAKEDQSQCGFTPSFPATCPYVLTVGATQGPEIGQPERACTSDQGGQITTGGGFSGQFPLPSWQRDAVYKYLYSGNTSKLPSMDQFAFTGRGYPDISAMGHSYQVRIGGKDQGISGTSAATPVIAGMITLINAERMNAGKGPLGFVNPSLYQLASTTPSVFNDITEGNNRCMTSPPEKPVCCDLGFTASVGWDPLTGVGSPNFAKLRDALVRLR